jgi:hypothetical protein
MVERQTAAVLDAAMAALDNAEDAETLGTEDGTATARHLEAARGTADVTERAAAAAMDAARKARGINGMAQLDRVTAYNAAWRKAFRAVQAEQIGS